MAARSLDRNLARLHPLCFRQVQLQNAVLDSRADFRGVNRRVEFKRPPIIPVHRFAIERLCALHADATMPDNRQFVVLQEDFQTFFADARHFCFEQISVFRFDDINRRRQEAALHLPVAFMCRPIFSLRLLCHCIHFFQSS